MGRSVSNFGRNIWEGVSNFWRSIWEGVSNFRRSMVQESCPNISDKYGKLG